MDIECEGFNEGARSIFWEIDHRGAQFLTKFNARGGDEMKKKGRSADAHRTNLIFFPWITTNDGGSEW